MERKGHANQEGDSRTNVTGMPTPLEGRPMWVWLKLKLAPKGDFCVFSVTACIFFLISLCTALNETWMDKYKITKIVRALWLAERRVCMRVCKHGCDVKMFCFSRANHASTNFWVQNSKRLLYLPILSSAETWKIFANKLYQFCFRLSWHFKREKSVFWRVSFCKTRTDYAWITRARLRVQDFGTGKNFCFNQCHNKEFLSFFSR